MGGMRWAFSICAIGLALLAGFAPMDARFVERWYSTGLYPIIQRGLTPVSNLVPFALLDILAVGGVCLVLLTLVRSVRSGAPQKEVDAAFDHAFATRDISGRDLPRVPAVVGTELSACLDDRQAGSRSRRIAGSDYGPRSAGGSPVERDACGRARRRMAHLAVARASDA